MQGVNKILFLLLTLCFVSCSNYRKAQTIYHTARNYSENHQETEAMAAYVQALDAIGTHKLHSDSACTLRGRIYSNIAYMCGLQRDNDLSIKYFSLAGKDYLQAHDTVRYVGNMLELVRIYNRDSTNYSLADSLLYAATTFTTDSILKGRITDTYSIIYRERSDFFTSLVYAQRALQFPATDSELLPYRHLQLSVLFHAVGLNDSVEHHAQYVINNSQNEQYKRIAYNHLSQLSQSNQQLNQALEYAHQQVKSTELISYQHEQLSRSTEILKQWEQSRKKRIWIAAYGLIVALLVVVLLTIIILKRRSDKQLWQQIDDLQQQLQTITNANERKLINRQIKVLKQIEIFATDHPDFLLTPDWKDYNSLVRLMSNYFPNLIAHLVQQGLNQNEQRICVLLFLNNYSSREIADACYISYASLSKLKSRLATKLNTTTKQLRKYIIDTVNIK